MNCQDLEENLPLLLYGELSASEQAACEEHLAGCANCRAAREKLEQFHQVLAQRPQVEVERRAAGRGAHGAGRSAWITSSMAGVPCGATACRLCAFNRLPALPLAFTLILLRLWLGLGTASARRRGLPPACRGVNSAGVAGPDLENMRISGISRRCPRSPDGRREDHHGCGTARHPGRLARRPQDSAGAGLRGEEL